jgi:hypothetical protein
MSATMQPQGLRDVVPATLLAIASVALSMGAAAALLIGWFWARTRGDWQAIVLWSYWFGTPVLSSLSLGVSRRHRLVKRANVSLLGIWFGVSLFALILPLL